jgi:hypothetical protein
LPEGKADNKQSPIFLEIGGIYMYIPTPNGRFMALGEYHITSISFWGAMNFKI